jgi:hypothetical protein
MIADRTLEYVAEQHDRPARSCKRDAEPTTFTGVVLSETGR